MRISQYIAIVGGVKSDTAGQMADLKQRVTKPELLSGISRTYRPRQEDGVQLPDQSTRVQVTAEDVLGKARDLTTRFLDVTRTLDEANARAKADVVVDGDVILEAVTTGHLIFLERELGGLHDFIERFPVLDQATTWSDEGQDTGIHRTPAVETERTDKRPYNHVRVKAEVIDGHVIEPVVDVMARDEVVGYWSTVKFSGALDPARKRELLDRITKLRDAVKVAREEANATVVEDVREGREIFGYLFR